jgi:hypothetical protein
MRRAVHARVRGIVVVVLVARVASADTSDDLIDPETGNSVATHAPIGELIEVHDTPPPPPVDPQQQRLTSTELHDLPGGGNDALRSLTSLPGVARIPFGLGGLALRGAAPHDTQVFLDGIPVPILYHFGGLASFVPIDAVDRVDMLASGAGAEWGGLIGGVVTLDSRSTHPTHWSADGEVSLLHAGVLAIGPGPADGSWMIGIRRSYVDAVMAAAQVDMALAPSYLDAQLRWESGDKHWLAIAFASQDDMSLLHDPNSNVSVGGVPNMGVSAFDYSSQFVRAGLRYQDGGFSITPYVGTNDMVATADQMDVTKGYTRSDALYGVRGSFTHHVLGGTLRIGANATATYYDYTISDVPPPSPWTPPGNKIMQREGQRMTTDAGIFVQQSWLVDDGVFEIRPGLRLDYLDLAGETVADPRLTLIARAPGATLSATIGTYHESPLVTDLDPIFKRDTLPAPAATQASVSADVGALRVTGYAASLSNLPVDAVTGATPVSANGGVQSGGMFGIARELVDAQFGSYSYREDVGRGHSYGLEVLAHKDLGQLTGWVAYTYARAFRTGDPYSDRTEYPYVLDQPHMLTLIAMRPLGAHWRIGGRLRFASGNPYTPVAGSYFSSDQHKWVAIDGPILSQRLPAFAQLDLRIDRTWRHWDLYLDIQNVTNHENVEGIDYSATYMQSSYTTGLPILPSIGLVYHSQ